jgi:hypothetical protein
MKMTRYKDNSRRSEISDSQHAFPAVTAEQVACTPLEALLAVCIPLIWCSVHDFARYRAQSKAFPPPQRWFTCCLLTGLARPTVQSISNREVGNSSIMKHSEVIYLIIVITTATLSTNSHSGGDSVMSASVNLFVCRSKAIEGFY